eukprot:3933735-Amphidinium_carterae.1
MMQPGEPSLNHNLQWSTTLAPAPELAFILSLLASAVLQKCSYMAVERFMDAEQALSSLPCDMQHC